MIDKYIVLLLLSCMSAGLFTGCKSDKDSEWMVSDELSITQWLESREDMTLLTEAMIETDLYNRMGVYGSFTLFAPNDEALTKFYAENPDVRYNTEALSEIILNHIVKRQYDTEDFVKGGFLNDTTLQGSFITVDMIEDDYIVNGRSMISESDLTMTNGLVHVIGETLLPPDESVIDRLSSLNKFSIFIDAINQFDDMVEILSVEEIDSLSTITVLAVPDDVYADYGVNNLDDLKQFSVDKMDSIGSEMEAEDALKRYIGGHILASSGINNDGFIFTGEIDDNNNIYRCMTDNLDFLFAQFDMSGEILINRFENSEREYNQEGSRLIIENSNNLCLNGLIHELESPLVMVDVNTIKSTENSILIVKEFEEGFYSVLNEETSRFEIGFYENAEVRWEGLELFGFWAKSSIGDEGPVFKNPNNTPAWFETTLNDIVPGTTYAFSYTGLGYNYSYVFVYLYPVDEEEQFLADPYSYKLKDGASETSIHAEKGTFEYPSDPKNYYFQKKLDHTSYRIRFDVRGKNTFCPGSLILYPQD